jgi:hypothetical protein
LLGVEIRQGRPVWRVRLPDQGLCGGDGRGCPTPKHRGDVRITPARRACPSDPLLQGRRWADADTVRVDQGTVFGWKSCARPLTVCRCSGSAPWTGLSCDGPSPTTDAAVRRHLPQDAGAIARAPIRRRGGGGRGVARGSWWPQTPRSVGLSRRGRLPVAPLSRSDARFTAIACGRRSPPAGRARLTGTARSPR